VEGKHAGRMAFYRLLNPISDLRGRGAACDRLSMHLKRVRAGLVDSNSTRTESCVGIRPDPDARRSRPKGGSENPAGRASGLRANASTREAVLTAPRRSGFRVESRWAGRSAGANHGATPGATYPSRSISLRLLQAQALCPEISTRDVGIDDTEGYRVSWSTTDGS
jgi:hypothetical protein